MDVILSTVSPEADSLEAVPRPEPERFSLHRDTYSCIPFAAFYSVVIDFGGIGGVNVV